MTNFDFNKFDKIINSTVPEILGMMNWNEEEKNEYLLKISKILENRVLDAILDELVKLGSDKKDKFENLMDSDPDKAYEFLTEQVPNIDEVAEIAVAKYKLELASKLNSQEA
jgi:hypothetical protein